MNKELYVITEGKYKDRVGTIDKDIPGWKMGNVMFYPIEKSNPYRVCVKYTNIKPVKEA